ncbi:hypothetical protein TNCV_4393241 [Trichonephila clavipes]|nr:hypothetical protein TNCV_4393241 [Trichonephila clavipes]
MQISSIRLLFEKKRIGEIVFVVFVVVLWLILSVPDGVRQDPRDHLPLRNPIPGGQRKKGFPSKVPNSPKCDLERLAESCTWCKVQKSSSTKGRLFMWLLFNLDIAV